MAAPERALPAATADLLVTTTLAALPEPTVIALLVVEIGPEIANDKV